MIKKYIKSPINYTGNKFKLLKQIIPLFPKNINIFVDLFCGGLDVTLNTSSNKTIANDINAKMISLYEEFKNTDENLIINHIHQRMKEYDLRIDNKVSYYVFRDFYNVNKNPLDLFTLLCFSFNHDVRFNNKGEYNQFSGYLKNGYNINIQNNLKGLLYTIKNKQIEFTNISFEKFNYDNLNNNDFIYCDPPYFISNTSYNVNFWNEDVERLLYNFLNKINDKGIKFGLSNVIEHKGNKNNILLQWSKKYNLHELNFNYNNSYNGNRKVNKTNVTKEVFICNY